MISSIFVIIFIITLVAFIVSIPLNGYMTTFLITHGAYDRVHRYDHAIESVWDYFDIVGALCFFFLGFGWGTILPVDQDAIRGKGKGLRTVLAYCAQPLVSIFLAVLSIIPSMFLTGKACIYTALNMFFVNSLHTATADSARYIFQQSASQFAHCSPYAITGTLFFIGIVYVQTTILCISMVRNAFQALLYPFGYQLMTADYAWVFMIAIPLLFCILFYQFFFSLALAVIILAIEIISSLIKGS